MMPDVDAASNILPVRTRLTATARRQEIVSEAICLVAGAGFEGLTTRAVAIRVGINSATLHHHFTSKKDLVCAIGDEMARRFRRDKTVATSHADDARAALAGQFKDALQVRIHEPELVLVYAELINRARRDAHVADVVKRLDEEWLADIRAILRLGVVHHVFRTDLDQDHVALVIFHSLRSAMFDPFFRDEEFKAMCDVLSRIVA
jgi:AcrR family transcriptional regulator